MGAALLPLLLSTQGLSEEKCRVSSHVSQSSCTLRAVSKPQRIWRYSVVKQPDVQINTLLFCFILPRASPRFRWAQTFSSWLPLSSSPPQWLSEEGGMSQELENPGPPCFNGGCPPWPLPRHPLHPLLLSGIDKSRKHIYLISGLVRMKSSNDCKRPRCCMVKTM